MRVSDDDAPLLEPALLASIGVRPDPAGVDALGRTPFRDGADFGMLGPDHQEAGAETSGIVDQAVEEGILKTRAVTGSVERRE
jgi:hypothetical protein